MRKTTRQILGFVWQICICFSIFVAFSLVPRYVHAEDLDQAKAQQTAANLNNRGSNDSAEAATTNGMTAIMNLAALNIPGAFTYGYKAYGEYLNSNEFDSLESKTAKNKNIMASVGSNSVSRADTKAQAVNKSSSGISGGSVFGRLDPNFLYKGEAAAVAEAFEKKTGMKREVFLSELTNAVEAGYTYDDPQLISKLYARYKSFTAKIPNKDFREGLERVEGLVPRSMQEQILGRLQDRFNSSGQAPAPTSVAEGIFNDKGASPAEAPKMAKESEGAAASSVENREPASAEAKADAPAAKKGPLGLFIGIGQEVSLDALLKGSPSESEDDVSLFTRVSARYRALSPKIQFRAKPAN